jgi:hypothetical protein
MKDSTWPMMVLRNNQGDCFRVGLSKQSPKLHSGCATRNEA